MNGVELILRERKRQIAGEGWKSLHDDQHANGQLADAAVCYAMSGQLRDGMQIFLRWMWPWALCWWKPTPNDRIRELTKAGALIAAEIDRLQRVKRKQRCRAKR